MKSALLTLFIIPAICFSLFIENPTKSNTIVVLELFTSQGCSSCPPADRYLNDIKSDNIIALSYHVDYWNYIGWKDPFSKSAFSDKQRQYGTKFNSRTIYTPQLVINGREHVVGSDKRLVNQKVSEYSEKRNANVVSLSNVSKNQGLTKFDYKVEGDITDKYIRTILVINERKTSVKRGENRNRELINTNIVVHEQRFKLELSSGKGAMVIPEIVNENDDLSLIVIVENKALDITGADQEKI